MTKHSTNNIRCEFDGTRLYALRVERGITMMQLAKALGMSESTISFYESGDRTPSFEACGKICNFFGCDLNYLFGTSDHGLEHFEISVKIVNDLIPCDLADCLGGVLIIQLRLGLPLESGVRMLYGNDSRHAVADVCPGKIGILFLEYADLAGVVIDHLGKYRLESRQRFRRVHGIRVLLPDPVSCPYTRS